MVKNFKQFIAVAALLLIAAGAQPVGAAIWQWSTTASTNASADPTINWAEGMSPSSVNDSARAMMAAIAAWRNDISATNTTGGTSTAYTLSTSEGVSSPPSNGQMISFLAHTANGVSPTLAVDGGTAYPLWFNGSAAGSGTLVQNTPYRVAFSVANSAWMLEAGYGNPYNVALGAIMWSTAPAAPNSSFIAPYGQCISTTTYNAYWVQQGSPASGSCPGGQFAVIDMRGRVAAALDTLPGSTAANRLTSNANGCGAAMTSVGAVCTATESTTLTTTQIPSHTHVNTLSDPGHSHVMVGSGGGGASNYINFTNNASSGVLQNVNQSTASATTGVSINNASAGGGGAHTNVQPTIGLIPYLRVL